MKTQILNFEIRDELNDGGNISEGDTFITLTKNGVLSLLDMDADDMANAQRNGTIYRKVRNIEGIKAFIIANYDKIKSVGTQRACYDGVIKMK